MMRNWAKSVVVGHGLELIPVSKTGPKRVVSLLVVVGNPQTIVVTAGGYRCFKCPIDRWFYRFVAVEVRLQACPDELAPVSHCQTSRDATCCVK